MTKDDIIKMARIAKIQHAYDSEDQWDGLTNQKLVDADETDDWRNDRIVEILMPFANLVAAYEREACIKICHELDKNQEHLHPSDCAEAIQARGN